MSDIGGLKDAPDIGKLIAEFFAGLLGRKVPKEGKGDDVRSK